MRQKTNRQLSDPEKHLKKLLFEFQTQEWPENFDQDSREVQPEVSSEYEIGTLAPKHFIELLSEKLDQKTVQNLLSKSMAQIMSIKTGFSDGKDVHPITMK